jgi:hypothetical protein
MRIFR